MILCFPSGLPGLFVGASKESVLFLAATGYAIYALLIVIGTKLKETATFRVFAVVFVFIVLLNHVGCVRIWKGVTSGMTLPCRAPTTPSTVLLTCSGFANGQGERWIPSAAACWCPMPYKDGMERLRRTPRDRYSAVVRLKDGSISFPEPAEIRNRPPMRDGLVFDLDLDSDTPTDRGWLQRDITKGPDQSKPAIVNDEGIPILTFDGERDAISVGPMLMPPVTASVECVFRTSDLSCNRTLFDSSEPILSLVLLKGGKVRLSRLDTWRREVAIESRSPLRRGAWHHLLASFDGDRLSLFIDGKLAAPRMHMRGTRSDKESTLGGPALWSEGVRAGHHFAGDIREFRVFQRTFDDADVAARAALA